jgi:pentatricopeptide repeat protein
MHEPNADADITDPPTHFVASFWFSYPPVTRAIALFKKMRADKVPIDAHVYSLVISILGKMKQVDVAVKLFEQYAATPNISKTVYPYNAVLGCFCQQRS